MGAKDNFWSSGPTGPCGPCSELYYDLHPGRGAADIDLDDGTRFIEFYNLVFMELNRGADGSTAPLAAKNIDTGLGLERMAQILQAVPNNYETDLIKPIMDKAAEIAGACMHASLARWELDGWPPFCHACGATSPFATVREADDASRTAAL